MFGRRKIWLAAGVMLPLAAWAGNGPGLTGNWARDDGTTRIKISPCGADLCAVNTFVKNPKGKEKVGDRLIMTLKTVSDSKLQGGAFDVRRQMHFNMTITMNGGKAMQTSGCVLGGIICKNAGWTRVD